MINQSINPSLSKSVETVFWLFQNDESSEMNSALILPNSQWLRPPTIKAIFKIHQHCCINHKKAVNQTAEVSCCYYGRRKRNHQKVEPLCSVYTQHSHVGIVSIRWHQIKQSGLLWAWHLLWHQPTLPTAQAVVTIANTLRYANFDDNCAEPSPIWWRLIY